MRGIDIDGVHVVLWGAADRRGAVRVQQNVWCDKFDITRYTLNRILRRLEEEGRLRSLTQSRGATVKTYVVADPDKWWADHGYTIVEEG